MTGQDRAFPMGEARKIVADLLTPNPWIFWLDLLATVTIAYSAALVYMTPGFPLAARVICYPVAGFALFRASLFMHEIVHFRRGEMVHFTVGWNLIAGIPMMIPSFLYESHLSHHNSNVYGTGNDGEYLPLGTGTVRGVGRFLLQIFVLPLYVIFRFLIISPISFLHPKLRQFVLERMSSFVINLSYRRTIPPTAPRAAWAAVELATFLRATAIFVVIGLGGVEWTRLLMLYSLALFSLGLNHIRTLVAHRYLSTGEKMSFQEQLEDSLNIEGGWLSELLFPVGLRYHALHHLFPSIPYHNLHLAHRRLVQQLPAGSSYHESTIRGFWAAVGKLLSDVKEVAKNPPPPAEKWYERREKTVRAIDVMHRQQHEAPAAADNYREQDESSTETAAT